MASNGAMSRTLPSPPPLPSFSTGTTSLSNWLVEHPRAVFVPPPEGYDFREAHVFDFSPKHWKRQSAQVKRGLLSPVAAPEDTVIDCEGPVCFSLFFMLKDVFFVRPRVAPPPPFLFFADMPYERIM